MQPLPVVFERRTIHRYRQEPVDEAVLLRALDAAQQAPCHKLTWPWRFTRVGPIGREALVARNIVLKGLRREMTPELEAKIRTKMEGPAHLLIVSQVRCEEPIRSQEDYASVAMAIQNLSLSLWSEGVGSKWSSGAVTRDSVAYEAAGVDPTLETIVGIVWVGVAEVVPERPARPNLDDVVRFAP